MIASAFGLFYAPRFLAYSTDFGKADAIVVLLGPKFNPRYQHALNLLNAGMADYLLIPAYNKMYFRGKNGIRLLTDNHSSRNTADIKSFVAPKYYEDTHLELIAAKDTLARYGKKSVIFVSSPYHMRRIQIMAEKEFDRWNVDYSPTPLDPAPLEIWNLKSSDWKKVWREYTKILWFLIYSS